MRLTETEIIMQIIQWRIWNNALVKTGFLKIEATEDISPLPHHYTSYKQKGSYLVFFSYSKSCNSEISQHKNVFHAGLYQPLKWKTQPKHAYFIKNLSIFFLFAFFP